MDQCTYKFRRNNFRRNIVIRLMRKVVPSVDQPWVVVLEAVLQARVEQEVAQQVEGREADEAPWVAEAVVILRC